MRRTIRGHLTYANVMASVAVFIALGGVSYAAVTLPKNSVGSSQITQNAVSGSEVNDSSLTGADIKDKLLTAADFDGSLQAPTESRLATLGPGTTLRGTFGMYGHGEVNNGLETASESVPLRPPTPRPDGCASTKIVRRISGQARIRACRRPGLALALAQVATARR
jgi:uncharacterized protein YjbI with pentapeptide repeats